MTTVDAEHSAVQAACQHVGLDVSTAVPLHRHATSVYLLNDRIVARINRSPDHCARARTAIAVVRWLANHNYPATAPLDVQQPVEIDDFEVTFWRYYPQHNRAKPGAKHLGTLLRQLHALPQPPIDLPPYRPLVRLGAAIAETNSLAARDRRWLSERRRYVLSTYTTIKSELGYGLVHGDAYPGNTLWNNDQVLLGDWDEVALAPRELDLVNTHQGAGLGRPKAERDEFTDAYGWDVTQWSGYETLREMRDLHTLGAFIERADHGDEIAGRELARRVATLRRGDTSTRWVAC